MTPPLLKALLVAVGALFVLMGTELAKLTVLRESGDLEWTSAVFVVMCAPLLLGGVVHGAARRSLPQLTLMVLLAGPPCRWSCRRPVVAAGRGADHDEPGVRADARSDIGVGQQPGTRDRPGEAVGLQDAATRLGLALGAPVVGFVIDHSSAAWGFAAAGLGGLLTAAVAYPLGRRIPEPALVTTGR